jgi:hypothetical protein
VVLAEAEDIEPDLVGEFDLLDLVTQPLPGIERAAGARIYPGLAEGVDAELHG